MRERLKGCVDALLGRFVKARDRPEPESDLKCSNERLNGEANEAKLLEVKSLSDNKTFANSIQEKIKLNLNLFYWLKGYINQ